MTEADKARYHLALMKKRDELVHDIHEHAVRLAISEGEHDPLDHVQNMNERDEAVTLLNSMWSNLSSIDAALRSFETDSYGTCIECGEAIASRRLDTLPWASHCVRCQEQLECDTSTGKDHHPRLQFDRRDWAA